MCVCLGAHDKGAVTHGWGWSRSREDIMSFALARIDVTAPKMVDAHVGCLMTPSSVSCLT